MKVDKFGYMAEKDKVLDVIYNLMHSEFEIHSGSFNARFYMKTNKEADEDIKKIKDELKKKYNLNLDDFFNKYHEEIYKDPKFIDWCAIVDYLLYSYDKKEGVLSGYHIYEGEINEYYIKYSYNYHKYDIGKKYILQNFGSMNAYYKETAKILIKSFLANNYIFPEKDISKSYSVKHLFSSCYVINCNMEILETLLDEGEYYEFKQALNQDKPFDNFKINDNILQIYINCDDIKKYNL